MINITIEYINSLLDKINQELMIGIMFVAALGYLINIFWGRMGKSSHACGDSCTGCSSINVNK